MEKALMMYRGNEKLVSAKEVQREFRGNPPLSMKFRCPLCHQPLFPAAMAFGGSQSPHFRHERNNDRAKECEFFASRYSYFTAYQRTPMPMFIRRSRGDSSRFIVESGFKSLPQSVLHRLESEEARLVVGRREYKIGRFGQGLVKLQLDEVSLAMGSAVRLVNTALGLADTWGYPEDARFAMVFSRDVDSEQGRRLNNGDAIARGADLYVLTTHQEGRAVQKAFEDCAFLGKAGSANSEKNLSVFGVTVPSGGDSLAASRDYLEKCGFKVTDRDEAPRLIWPPSKMSSGEVIPLFKGSPCIFVADTGSLENRSLYVHAKADSEGGAKVVPAIIASDHRRSFAVFEAPRGASFVASKDWAHSMAVLVHPDDCLDEDVALGRRLVLEVVDFDGSRAKVDFRGPARVVLLHRHEQSKVIPVEREGELKFDVPTGDLLRIERGLDEARDAVVLVELGQAAAGQGGAAAEGPPSLAVGRGRLSAGLRLATLRNAGIRPAPGEAADMRFALAREVSR